MALVNAQYQVIYANIGAMGRNNDASVFMDSDLSQGLENDTLMVPPPECPPNSNIFMPYVVIADDAFPLTKYLMKPYSNRQLSREKQHYNYRHSRAHLS